MPKTTKQVESYARESKKLYFKNKYNHHQLVEILKEKWWNEKEIKELVETFINKGSGCEFGCSPEFVRKHFGVK